MLDVDKLGDCEFKCIAVDDGLRFERCGRCGKRRVVADHMPRDEQAELMHRWLNNEPMFIIGTAVVE